MTMLPLTQFIAGIILGVSTCGIALTMWVIIRATINENRLRRERFERRIDDRITDLSQWTRDQHKVVANQISALEKGTIARMDAMGEMWRKRQREDYNALTERINALAESIARRGE